MIIHLDKINILVLLFRKNEEHRDMEENIIIPIFVISFMIKKNYPLVYINFIG